MNGKFIGSEFECDYAINDTIHYNNDMLTICVTKKERLLINKNTMEIIKRFPIDVNILPLWLCTIRLHNKNIYGYKENGYFKYDCGCIFNVDTDKLYYGSNSYIYCPNCQKIVIGPKYIKL